MAISGAAGDGAPHPKWEWAASRVRQRRDLCEIDPVRTEIAKLEEELNSIELSHPPVSSFKQHRGLNPMELSHSQAPNFKRHHSTFR